MALPASIDTLKATIARRGGVARSNRFAIYMAHPSKKVNLINTDLSSILGNAARSVIQGGSVSLGSFLEDPRDIFLLCESVNIPGRQVATNEFFTDMKGVKRPYQFINDEVQMTFNLTNDYYMFKYMRSWMDAIIPTVGSSYRIGYKKEYTTDIVIQQLAGTNWIPVHGVVLRNAYPTQMSQVQLGNNMDNSVAQITATFTFDDWTEQSGIRGAATGITTGLSAISNAVGTVANIGKLF